MTATAALMKQTTHPGMDAIVEALVADIKAMAAEWSVGNDLSMISRERVADENARRIALNVALTILRESREDGDKLMGDMVAAYLKAMTARKDFLSDDRDDRMEDAAWDIERIGTELAEEIGGDGVRVWR